MNSLSLAQAESKPSSQREKLLISPESLSQTLSSKDSAGTIRLLDTRDEKSFAAGHLPGAIRVDMTAWKALSSQPDGLTSAEKWTEPLSNLSIGDNMTVVVYGEALPESARLWWLLTYLGVQRVQILDGGFKAWQTIAAPIETDVATYPSIERKASLQNNRLATLETVLASVKTSGAQCVVDNRSAGEYSGKSGQGARKGHVPGAKNLDWVNFVDENGKFLSNDKLQELITQSGIASDQPVITHCQTGGRSSVGAFVFELLGYSQVRNYYRSWSEYSANADTPIE